MLQLEIYVYPLVMFAEGWPEIWKYWTKNSAQNFSTIHWRTIEQRARAGIRVGHILRHSWYIVICWLLVVDTVREPGEWKMTFLLTSSVSSWLFLVSPDEECELQELTWINDGVITLVDSTDARDIVDGVSVGDGAEDVCVPHLELLRLAHQGDVEVPLVCGPRQPGLVQVQLPHIALS